MRAGRAVAELSAVFLDRDGVINAKAPEGNYVTSWERFRFLPGALEGLALLSRGPAPIVVATNQRGIARGRMSGADLQDIHDRMLVAVERAGGRIDAIYHCPHEGGCECRKPGTGMFERAARDLGIDLAASAMVGDRSSDMEAAARVGALRVLVAGSEDPPPAADHTVADLEEAARWLLSYSASSNSRSSAS